MKPILILGVSLVGGACSFCLLNWFVPQPVSSRPLQTAQGVVLSSEQGSAQDRMSELQEEVRQLALELALLRRQIASGSDAPPSAAVRQEAQSPPLDRRSPEAKATAKLERQERIADVEADFRREVHDPRWSAPTESSIRDAFGALSLTNGSLETVQCQTQTCRVELTVKDPVELSNKLPDLITRLAGQLHGSVMDFVDKPGGEHTGVLYLFR